MKRKWPTPANTPSESASSDCGSVNVISGRYMANTGDIAIVPISAV